MEKVDPSRPSRAFDSDLPRETVVTERIDEVHESGFDVRLRRHPLGAPGLCSFAQRDDPVAPLDRQFGVEFEEILTAHDAQVPRVVDGPPEPAPAHDLCQVEHGERRGRDGHALEDPAMVRWKARELVDGPGESLVMATLPVDHDVDRFGRVSAESPEPCGRGVGGAGVKPRLEDLGEDFPVFGDGGAGDGTHVGVDRLQAAGVEPPAHFPAVDSELAELGSTDEAVLGGGEICVVGHPGKVPKTATPA